MLDLWSNPFLIISAILFIVCLVLFFVNVRHKLTQQTLNEEVNKYVTERNQLNSKFDQLFALKHQQDQALTKAETQVENLHIRLQERDEKIQYLSQELDEEQVRHENVVKQMVGLKENLGATFAQIAQLKEQLSHSQQQINQKDQEAIKLNEKLTALSQQFTELKTTLTEKEKHFAQQQQMFTENKQQLTTEFQNLANQILEEKSQRFNQTNQTALHNLLKPFREQIDGFQKRINDIHSETLKGNAGLEAEIKKVLEIGLNMSKEANNLTSALKGEKKTLGNWGEVQLASTLQNAGLVEGEHYVAQGHFKDAEGKHNYPDFVLNLPDNKHLIIDSKVSLNAYESAVSAEQDIERQQFLQEHLKAIKNHIDDLSRKDYSNLIGVRSPNFVLMFVAIEPAYIEAMKQDKSLFNYGYERNVILVSHTTLMPILRTVANLWRIERGNKEAREISEKAGEIYNQICLIAERLAKLGNSLSSVSSHYNSTVTALVGQQGLAGKVERFKTLSAKANKTMPHLDLLHNDIDSERLAILNDKGK